MAEDGLADRAERETRFTDLLHPNRDLATNWTVDVGKQLEEYLTELAATGIFDDGQCGLNFAEAALLIQGSIQVYSRKVEYLYALVLQALNFLGQKKQGGEEGASTSQAEDDDGGNAEEKDEEFLNLDDVPEEANIDILDEEAVSSVRSAVKLPACLLATEADPADLMGEAGELATYETATSIMHRAFLLLDPCDSETVDKYLDGGTFRAENGAVPATPGSALRMRTPREQHQRSAMKRVNPETPHGFAGEGGGAFDCEPSWQGDGDFGGTDWDDENADQRNDDHGATENDTRDGAAAMEVEKDDYIDPWAPLNPHESGTLLIKPYKKGPTQRKKPRVKKRRSDATPVASRTGVCFTEFLKAFQVREQSQKAERRRHEPDDDVVPSFETLRNSFQNSDAGLPADEAVGGTEGLGGEFRDDDMDENDMDNWAGPSFEPQEHADFDIPDINHAADPPDPLPGQEAASKGDEYQQTERSPYMDMPSFDVEREEGMSFEELCRAHLESMLRKLSEANSRTGLASRVSKWKNKIEATLVDEDTRPPFDIHDYGDRLLDELATVAATSHDEDEETQESFTYLVRGQRREQVARSFSALLQLVNNGNVTIERGQLSSDSVCFTGDKPFVVKLLSAQNKHEGMFDNMVPARASKKTPGRNKTPRLTGLKVQPRGKQQRVRSGNERSLLGSSPRSPNSPGGARSLLAASMSPSSVRGSRKRRQTGNLKRGGSPDKENTAASTPLHTTPSKITADGRPRSRRKALSKLV
ncbi:hypothetical protein R1sor_011697 [Riccia sorocarpa]|uniref:Condensin-2 complex subunit H2 n=1 Tax=Riccia sorocarpa TaxID=122646 RepID=A0ABD3I2Y8_9MARC